MTNHYQPKIGGLGNNGFMINGRTKQLHQLTNLEKEGFFKSIFDDVNSWKKKISELDGVGNPYERTGIYTRLYSLLDYRLETLWWNYAYQRKWGVYDKRGFEYDHLSGESKEVNVRRYFAPSTIQWMKRQIPSGLRKTGTFILDLYGGEIGRKKSNVNDEQLLPDTLFNQIQMSELDRKEMIHRNLFYIGEIRNDHIETVIKIFRGIDRMVTKHQLQFRELLVEPKIPNRLVS